MKFQVYELKLESKNYRFYDVIDVPNQLRVVYPQGSTPTILANASAFSFLESIFKIASVKMKDNSIIRIKDNSEKKERFHNWYPASSEYHMDLIISNYQYTQVSSKKISRLLKMLKYRTSKIIDISVPTISYNHELWWKLEGTLHVDKRSDYLTISSNGLGLLYMAKEASYYHDIDDDEEENFAHSHLFALCKHEDLLDMKYYYEAN